MNEEFALVSRPIIRSFWDQGYFTMPMPGDVQTEFKLDLPAFERLDIIAMKWNDEDLDVIAVESKMRKGSAEQKAKALEAVPQARTYQLCIPEVYIASNERLEDFKAKDLRDFERYGIGLISVDSGSVKCLVSPRKSRLFNRIFFETEVVPRVKVALGFCDFLTEVQGWDRERILREMTYGITREPDQLWLSDREASSGIQWSTVLDERSLRFGVNIENSTILANAIKGKPDDEIRSILKEIRTFPSNARLCFHRRCPLDKSFVRGSRHTAYPGFDEGKPAYEITDSEIEFIIKTLREDTLPEFAIWFDICQYDELLLWQRREIWSKMREFKATYLDGLYKRLAD